jgi:hypothetical protein
MSMSRTRGWSAVPVVMLVLGVARAAAQTGYVPVPGPALPPRYSPYLNLTRPGGTPAMNYYGLVRPEVEARNAYLGLQQQVNVLQQQVATQGPESGALPTTGYPIRFLDYSSYFPAGPGRGAYRGPVAPPPAAAAPVAPQRPAPVGVRR